ncbi:hypothetical protein DUNSADRAFT_17564 [Dunaliella salina]|uniref:RRM domain-containing protein n=1 Tax=Dunaliella salina TaxID=3046 RepID=A0ABQ7G1L1_DUNSA|nr:hypothetical protein DUNSADRAFT_17564 [Dunaliella salina]|eukprot:KAF5828487.1 hypothetical protein DUNSADRAFT_17564 [Dunaliella salina]
MSERRTRRRESRWSRSRSRSPVRSSKWDSADGGGGEDPVARMAALQQQQLMMQQQHQALLMQQQAQAAAAQAAAIAQATTVSQQPPANEMALDAPPTPGNKKQRELYIGNLAVGIVHGEMLRELFNAVLGHMVPDPIATPPVLEVKQDPTGRGRFAFIELRTAALALAALQLDKQLDLCGRAMNIGRPKGYVDPPQFAQQNKLSMAQMFAAQLSGGPSNCVLIEGLANVQTMRNEDEKRELYDEVYAEASRFGSVSGLAIPTAPPHIPPDQPSPVILRYSSVPQAEKCKAAMDGRQFDDNTLKASFVAEPDFYKAYHGDWFPQH